MLALYHASPDVPSENTASVALSALACDAFICFVAGSSWIARRIAADNTYRFEWLSGHEWLYRFERLSGLEWLRRFERLSGLEWLDRFERLSRLQPTGLCHRLQPVESGRAVFFFSAQWRLFSRLQPDLRSGEGQRHHRSARPAEAGPPWRSSTQLGSIPLPDEHPECGRSWHVSTTHARIAQIFRAALSTDLPTNVTPTRFEGRSADVLRHGPRTPIY